INIKFQDAIADCLADIEHLLIWRDTDAVSVVKIVRDLDPSLPTGSKVKNLSHDGGWRIDEVSKKGGVGAAISGHHDVVDAAIELIALVIGVPSAQLLAVEVELENGSVFIRAGEKKSLLFRESQPVMAAVRCVIQNGCLLPIPLRQGVGDPADKIKIPLEIERTFGSEDVLHDDGFLGPRHLRRHERGNDEYQNFHGVRLFPPSDSVRDCGIGSGTL